MSKIFLLAFSYILFNTQGISSVYTGRQKSNWIAIQPDSKNERNVGKKLDQVRTYKTKFSNDKGQKVFFFITTAKVQVIGRNSDEVIIESTTYNPLSEEATDLKPLINRAKDNTNTGLQVLRESNKLKITQASKAAAQYVVYIPKNASIVYEEVGHEGQDVSLSAIEGEVELKLNKGGALITNVPGPVVANSIEGSINISFVTASQSKPSAISCITGNINITLPADFKSSLKLKAMQGEIYTDFLLTTKGGNKLDLPTIASSSSFEGQMNGGVVPLTINALNGDIFIRKKK